MINKERYLNWIQPQSDTFSDEVVFREMYSRIGYIFHVLQMIEYNLANILSIEEFEKETKTLFSISDIDIIKKRIEEKFDKLSELTFGKLKEEIKQSIYLKSIDFYELTKIKDYRDYLAHRCFKERLIAKKLDILEDVDEFVEELNRFEERVIKMNNFLVEIFKEKRIQPLSLSFD